MLSSIFVFVFVFVFVFRSSFVFIFVFVFVYWTHPRLRLSSIKVHSRLCLKWSQVIHTQAALACSRRVENIAKYFEILQMYKILKQILQFLQFYKKENKVVPPLQTRAAYKWTLRLKPQLFWPEKAENKIDIHHNKTSVKHTILACVQSQTMGRHYFFQSPLRLFSQSQCLGKSSQLVLFIELEL